MKKSVAVIGLGRFGASIATSLPRETCSVIAVDVKEERVRSVADHVAHAVVMDAMDEKALRDAGINSVDVAVVSIGENIEASTLVVMLLKELGVKEIIAKAVTELHGKVLALLGVNRVVHPERDMAQRVAGSIMQPGLLESIELSRHFSIVELSAPDFIWGKELKETNLRALYGLNIIAIKRTHGTGAHAREDLMINPEPTQRIEKGDLLTVLGKNDNIEKMLKKFAK